VLRNSDAEALLDQLDAAHDRDAEQIETMLMAFERASPAVRERMRVSGNPCDRQRWLNGYAYGKANQALRFRAEPALELGLLALCVHNFACDFRDDYVVLAHRTTSPTSSRSTSSSCRPPPFACSTCSWPYCIIAAKSCTST